VCPENRFKGIGFLEVVSESRLNQRKDKEILPRNKRN
jgi:hypothetical protein